MRKDQHQAVDISDWALPSGVRVCITDRFGGVSQPPFDQFNLATHVNDDPVAVAHNRQQLLDQLTHCQQIHWLQQVHSSDVHVITADNHDSPTAVTADASVSRLAGQACCVLTADCLPVLFCRNDGLQVAAAHAGWRGLAAGVLQKTLAQFPDPSAVRVFIGPAIGPRQFQVGEEVLQAFQPILGDQDEQFFQRQTRAQTGLAGVRYLADLAAMAEQFLRHSGVVDICQSGICSVENPHYYSYRREGVTGRFASLIWIDKAPS